MLRFLRRFGLPEPRRRARHPAPAGPLQLEALESRDLPAPLAPTGLSATGISASAIALSWSPSPDPTVTGYDVYEKVWVPGVHSPRGSGGTPGHYSYVLRGNNLTTPADTLSGLKTGSSHDYVVTALSPSGQSPYSADAVAKTWFAPSFPNGPSTYLLSSGALFSGPLAVTAGLTTQLSLLVNGNPLTFSVLSDPSTVMINAKTGLVTYTPAAGEVGTVKVTFQASNPLGAVTQTIQFNVAAYNPRLARPTLQLSATTAIYTGQSQGVAATAVGKDGKTPVAGSFAFAFNGSLGLPSNVGIYQVLVTFISSNPSYGNATLLTSYTITRATPAFSSLSAPTIAAGTTTTLVMGHVAAGSAVPKGDTVLITLNDVTEPATVDANGNFQASYATGGLAVGSYTISYAFAGDANFNAAAPGSSTLQVIPTAPPAVTVNPTSRMITAGDFVTFTAAATGVPAPSVQWQVSTDGGMTWANITGNASALTNTLTFAVSTGQNGYRYRAVFTNSVGSATTSTAQLTVQGDSGGDN